MTYLWIVLGVAIVVGVFLYRQNAGNGIGRRTNIIFVLAGILVAVGAAWLFHTHR